MRDLTSKHISKIFVGELKPTQSSSDSLLLQLGIDTEHYIAYTSCADLFKLISINKTNN